MNLKKMKQAIFEQEYQQILYKNREKLVRQYQLLKSYQKLKSNEVDPKMVEASKGIIVNPQMNLEVKQESVTLKREKKIKRPDYEDIYNQLQEAKKIINEFSEKNRLLEAQIRAKQEKFTKTSNIQESFMVSSVSTKSSFSLQQEDLIQQN